MILKQLLLILVFISTKGFCQNLQVLISEEKTGNRTILYAENKTADTLNVFFMVNAEGYRKSASKPVIKNIAPGEKEPMATLIELKDEPSRYTYDLIINKSETDIHFTYDKQAKDIRKLIEGKLVIFSMEKCSKCLSLSNYLTEQRIAHRIFDITDDAILYNQFMQLIERELTNETRIRFPVIWNKNAVIFGFDTLEDITPQLLR